MVANKENYQVGDLTWGAKLYEVLNKSKSVYDPTNIQLIDFYHNPEYFSVDAGSQKNIALHYNIPSPIPDASYLLRLYLYNPELGALNWHDLGIGELGIKENFASIKTASIVTPDNKEFDVMQGASVSAGQMAQLKLGIYWPGNNTNADYKINIFDRTEANSVINNSASQSPLAFKSDKTNSFNINIPQVNNPGSYLGEIIFTDSSSKGEIAPILFFRWVVSGESGRILFANLDKSSYASGENAKLNAILANSADLADPAGNKYPSVGTVDLNASIICSQGTIGQKETQIDFGDHSTVNVNLNIPVDKNGTGCQASMTLAKEGKIMHQYQTNPELNSNSGVNEQQAGENSAEIWEIIGIGVIILIIILAAIIIKKHLKNKSQSYVQNK